MGETCSRGAKRSSYVLFEKFLLGIPFQLLTYYSRYFSGFIVQIISIFKNVCFRITGFFIFSNVGCSRNYKHDVSETESVSVRQTPVCSYEQ
jgi:hypothetical protein